MEAKEVSVNGYLLTETHLKVVFDDIGLPKHMVNGLYLYLTYKIPPGSFMLAVLSNDLMDAVRCADHLNRHCLFGYADLMYNHLPPKCFGSKEKVTTWLKG